MKYTLTDRTLALAGLFQAARQVQEVARNGRADSAELETAMYSLFQTDPPDVAATYGNMAALRSGLYLLHTQFSGLARQREVDITRYVISLMHLERRLARRKEMLTTVHTGIERARRQSAHFSITHDNVIANLADLYAKTLSQLTPRIMVAGEPRHLAVPANANTIRALLLAGIRSAVLWRQCGGNRWQILFQRRALTQEAKRLLDDEAHPGLH